MRSPQVDDYVRVVKDIPELHLQRGAIGVVRSTWFAPAVAYEVEFHPVGLDHNQRALLLAEQVMVEEGSLMTAGQSAGSYANPSLTVPA